MPGLLTTAQRASDDVFVPSPLRLDEEELEFYQKATEIDNRDALTSRILAARREAFEKYPDVNNKDLTKLILTRLPGYEKVLKVGRSRRNPILLSIGNEFGVDVRKAIMDGYPADSVVATDRDDALWAVGEQLFSATQEIGRIPFLPGDFLHPYFLEAVWPFYTKSYAPPPTLSTLKSLDALHGQVSVVSACFVFDNLNASQQLQLARGIAGLLSAESGSMVIGVHRVSPPSGSSTESHTDDSGSAFYHTPESWSDLWDGQLFQKGTVKVETILVESQELGMSGDGQVMEWTIVRL